ncbi:Hexapeptide repeat-containing acetyltransferase [Planctomycetales bacterium 10988]|nr:Hexapeptide repeat-containing acetyltransferase [Planctomycetales bacterium 10988]
MKRQTQFRSELIHPTVFLAAGSQIVGEVHLAEEASVWFNAVLRGDTTPLTIGPRSNIQDGAILHADPGFPTIIAEEVTVGHGAIVHGAKITSGALIGMRAVLLNGAQIGEESLIGAGAIVKEKQVIPPGVLAVGTPARVVRELTQAERKGLRETALRYVEAARQYRETSGS